MNTFLFLGPGLLRTIVVLVAIYYGSKFLFRWWLKRKVENAVKQREQTMSEQEASQKKQTEGSVHIKSNQSAAKSSAGGEYVDYEEVE